jgi:hypothetical protein
MFPKFSDEYSHSLEFRERIEEFTEKSRKELIGSTIYGIPLDVANDQHVIAALYLKLQNYNSYHE